MPSTEERTAKIEGLMEQMDKRLTNIEAELARIHTRIDLSSDQINNEFTKVGSKFEIIDKRLTALETSNKKIILSLDRMEKKNGHLRTSLHKVARTLHDV